MGESHALMCALADEMGDTPLAGGFVAQAAQPVAGFDHAQNRGFGRIGGGGENSKAQVHLNSP